MCEPTTLMMASLAISAASAGVQYDTGRKTANTQADAIKRNDELQALDSARQQSQIAAQGAEDMNQAARAAHADLASLDAIAGEYGGGNSVDRARSVIGVQAGESAATVSANARGSLNESAAAAYAGHSRNLSQIGAIQRPSLALAGLQIGGALTDYYDIRERRKGAFSKRDPNTVDYRGTTLPNSLRGGQ